MAFCFISKNLRAYLIVIGHTIPPAAPFRPWKAGGRVTKTEAPSRTLATLGTLLAFASLMPAVRVLRGGTVLPSWGSDGAGRGLEGGGGAVLSAVPSCDLSLFCLHR